MVTRQGRSKRMESRMTRTSGFDTASAFGSPCGCGEGSIGTVIGIKVKELADLTMALAAINAGNRVAISFRDLLGDYQQGQFNHLLERQAH
jgi:hypothetical protein